jgi:hypothetical protein
LENNTPKKFGRKIVNATNSWFDGVYPELVEGLTMKKISLILSGVEG